jgi:hypothetical protein
MFQCLVVGRMPTHANTPHKSPEHVNVLYERGVAAHQCSYAFQVLGASKAHPGESTTVRIGSYTG